MLPESPSSVSQPTPVSMQEDQGKKASSRKIIFPIVVLISLLIIGFSSYFTYNYFFLPKDHVLSQIKVLSTSFQNLDPCQTFPQYCQREGWELGLTARKKETSEMMQKAETAYRSKNTEAFRQELLDLKKWMNLKDFGGPPEDGRFLKINEPEEAKKHDPQDKYVKNDKISLVVRPMYWQVIDLLVKTDNNYGK